MHFKTAWKELIYSFTHPYQWFLLAWYDIKQRYRRSILGPFWITISTAILIGTLGLLWSTLFKADVQTYLPYFATGYVLWMFISSQFVDSTAGFVQFESILKQHRLPYPSYILRLLSRNFIIFLHNCVIILVVVSFTKGWNLNVLYALPGMFVVILALLGASLITSILCLRYRDLALIVQNIVTVLYFLSPIMWQASTLPEKYHWIIGINPMSYLLDIVRKPILGSAPSAQDWLFSIGIVIVLFVISYILFDKKRNRIAYWL